MKLFKDLPSTDTPINAENLNQIQDNLVVVSATEPTGDNREKVWIQKGNNLLEVTENNKTKTNAYANIIRGNISTIAGEPYTISFDTVNNGGTVYAHEGVFNYGAVVCDGKRKTMTVTAKYTQTFYNKLIIASSTAAETAYDLSNIQIKHGTVGTDYEEYIEPVIYVKNDNDVYEQFISKDEPKSVLSVTDSTYNISVNAYKAGNILEILLRTVNIKEKIPQGQVDYDLATLPVGCRPISDINYLVTTSSGTLFNLLITTAGAIRIGYVYKEISAGSQITNANTILVK